MTQPLFFYCSDHQSLHGAAFVGQDVLRFKRDLHLPITILDGPDELINNRPLINTVQKFCSAWAAHRLSRN